VEIHSQLKEVYGGRVKRVHHVRKWCTEFESCRMDSRDKNRTGRRSTRTDVEELNLEQRGVTIRSRRFHGDNKLEMTVREWWRMEHPQFLPCLFFPPNLCQDGINAECARRLCSKVNGTSVEQMRCIEICNEFSFNLHDLGNLLGPLNILRTFSAPSVQLSQLLQFAHCTIFIRRDF